jgi:hypothetical protein
MLSYNIAKREPNWLDSLTCPQIIENREFSGGDGNPNFDEPRSCFGGFQPPVVDFSHRFDVLFLAFRLVRNSDFRQTIA